MSDRIVTAFIPTMTSGYEIAIVAVAILVLFGAKALPNSLRTLGRWMEQLRRVSDEFRGQLMDAESQMKKGLEWDRDVMGEPVSSGEQRPQVVPEDDDSGDGPAKQESGDGG